MELTFLVDNNALGGKLLHAEPALSMLIADDETRVLMDAGYTDAFLNNARRMGIDLLDIDHVVLSHGHYDHTWGLDALIRHYYEAGRLKLTVPHPTLVAHPRVFETKFDPNEPEFGPLFSKDKAQRHFNLKLSAEPRWITKRMLFLGEIERRFDFEATAPSGYRMTAEGSIKDDLLDDSSLVYVTDTGLVVITGCAHAGVCNTVEYARQVTGVDKVRAVIGGFHLRNAKPERLDPTTDYLANLELEALYPCHCTDLAAKIALARKCPVVEAGCGLKLEF
ncbi:MBL fold metallo-hydrolase [Pseudodesulfovibrio sp. zrk46]|uniref:MBL fold metallo-hydrolase n=1 Tax=Pseudodesulfovibrio sp. zrk46 TaxID=2725288 RepID=UPI001449044C|nr:MBL fold metallo-hydrolase [Pseudodesulfovibrio sp. zrk46]QJB56204.1 MBL fold metallo-hydrolase [Pseudodesulfovibrio sp. zrk46]